MCHQFGNVKWTHIKDVMQTRPGEYLPNILWIFIWILNRICFGLVPVCLELIHWEHLQSYHPWPCIKTMFKIICFSRSKALDLPHLHCRYLPNSPKRREKKSSAVLLADRNSLQGDIVEGINVDNFALEIQKKIKKDRKMNLFLTFGEGCISPRE